MSDSLTWDELINVQERISNIPAPTDPAAPDAFLMSMEDGREQLAIMYDNGWDIVQANENATCFVVFAYDTRLQDFHEWTVMLSPEIAVGQVYAWKVRDLSLKNRPIDWRRK